jgi:hypothetical protein
VGQDIFYFILFLPINDIGELNRRSWSYGWMSGDIWFKMFHILDWFNSAKPWGHLYQHSVRPSNLKDLQRSNPSGTEFVAG